MNQPGFAVAQSGEPLKTSPRPTARQYLGSASAKSSTAKSDKLDINSVSQEQLGVIPGMGQACVQKDNCLPSLPHQTERDLVTREIIPRSN